MAAFSYTASVNKATQSKVQIGSKRKGSNARSRNGGRQIQGMNWCRQSTRLSVYLRDGLSCVYCGDAVEEGTKLTLDHVIPHTLRGSDKPDNLVTSCKRCNETRGAKPLEIWKPRAVAKVRRLLARPIAEYRIEAKKLIARRGSCARVLAAKVK